MLTDLTPRYTRSRLHLYRTYVILILYSAPVSGDIFIYIVQAKEKAQAKGDAGLTHLRQYGAEHGASRAGNRVCGRA